MTVIPLVLLVALGNLVLGFVLAAQLGHGPAWAKLPAIRRPPDPAGKTKSSA